MGAIAERGDDKALKLFRDVLLASCSIPGILLTRRHRRRGQRQEIPGDARRRHDHRAVLRRAGIHARRPTSKSRPPLSQLYVIVNSKLAPEFKMPDRNDRRRARPLDRRGADVGAARRDHADVGRSAAATGSACASRMSIRRSTIRRAARSTASTCTRCLISASSKARRAPPSRTCCATSRCADRTTRAEAADGRLPTQCRSQSAHSFVATRGTFLGAAR